MYKLKRTGPKMLPCGTPKLLSLRRNLYHQLGQTAFVLKHNYELILKLAQKNLTCEAFPIQLGDRLYQVPCNSQLKFQG